jgi:hypothetical protein
MLHRIADPCQAQLRSHKLDLTSEAPKDWILLGNSQDELNLHIIQAFCDTPVCLFARIPIGG